MTSITTNDKTTPYEIPLMLLAALAFTILMAYIDEGNYNFNWMNEGGSWIAVLMYTSAMFGGQLFLSRVVLNRYSGIGKMLAVIVLGSILGFFLLLAVFYSFYIALT